MERNEWNKKVKEYAPSFGAFLQSYEWGIFQEELGNKIVRIHKVEEEKEMMGLGIWRDIKGGFRTLYFPKGPLGNWEENKILEAVQEEAHGAMAVRMEPQEEMHILGVKETNPRSTILVDLTKSEDQILSEMKSKTRYNMRLGKRKGVEIREMDRVEEFEAFWLLMQQTARRDGIRLHEKRYYETLLEAMSQKIGAHAFLVGALYEGRLLAANIVIDFNGVRTYAHGATSNVHRNVMAQYVLHSHLLFDAKEKGMTQFDFWGAVSKEEIENGHAWAGISRYKHSFGGDFVEMPGTFDFVMQPIKYEIYRGLRKIRSFI